MSLIDTTDNILMLGAYGWAFIKPVRKLYYNMTITFVSVVVALVVGGIEALGLLAGQFHWNGLFWGTVLQAQRQLRRAGLLHHRDLCAELDFLHRDLQMAALRRVGIRRLSRSANEPDWDQSWPWLPSHMHGLAVCLHPQK